LLVGPLVHTEAEIMPPQFLAVLSVETERQQGFLVFPMRRDEHSVAIDHGRTGSPARQIHRPADILGFTPTDGQFPAVRYPVSVSPSPAGPIGTRFLAVCRRN